MEHHSEPLFPRSRDIEKIMSITGTPGVTVGVARHGKKHYANLGYRDHASHLPTTKDTIYSVGSLTQASLAAVAGLMVEDGKLRWDTRVKDVLKDFNIKDDTIREQCTLADLLCHRSGMATGGSYLGSENNIMVPLKDGLKFISNQDTIHPFRAGFQYNNLGYELAGLMISQAAGESWSQIMKRHLFEPLQMYRTYLNFPPETEQDVAKAYGVLDDSTPVEIPTVKATEHTFGGPSSGMRSCAKDLLKLYETILHSTHDQAKTGKSKTPGSPFVRMNEQMAGQIPIAQPSFRESAYAFGWARVQLAGSLGHLGGNPSLMPRGMPVVGRGAKSQLAYYHQSSLPGASHSVILLPECDIVIVVLTNALALNDCADWAAQVVLEEILGPPKKNDFLEAAKMSVAQNLKWYPTVSRQMEVEPKPNMAPKSLSKYIGTYWNAPHYLKIVVTRDGNRLFWAQQGWESEKYELRLHYGDTFSWLQPRNYLVTRGRRVDQPSSFWTIRFRMDRAYRVTSLVWVHDSDVPQGEEFFKKV